MVARSAIMVQRRDYSSTTAKTLLSGTAQADVPQRIVADHGDWLATCNDAERIDLINACLASESGQASSAIDLIWFRTANWIPLARANLSVWQRSLAAMGGVWLTGYFFKNLLGSFLFDVEQVAAGYLDMNQAYCTSSLGEMFYDHDGKPLPGPPTAAQQSARANSVDEDAVQDALGLQEKLKATRTLVIGTVGTGAVVYLPDGRTARGTDQTAQVRFDPDQPPPPQLIPLPGDPPERKWKTIKAGYDEGTGALRRLLSLHPRLYLLIRGNFEDTGKTGQAGADKSPGRAKTTDLVASELAGTLRDITIVRPMLGKELARELLPIHEQLKGGQTTSPRNPGRNWASDPVWRAAADAYTDYNKPGPWWQTMGLAVAEAGVFILAGLATGGVGFAAAMAVKGGVEAAMAAGKSQVLSAAAGASVTPDTELVTAKQAEAAQTEAVVATAFAVLDALMVGVELRAVGATAKLARTAGGQAAKTIEMSQRVLEYERKLLGRVSASEASTAATDARKLAGDARRIADEAKATGDASAARMADRAAKRAEDAAGRVEKLAESVKTAEQAGRGVPAADIATAFEVPLAGGGKIVVSKTGKVFRCASPCQSIIDLYADVIARHPTLKARAGAVETAQQEAQNALPGLSKSSAAAVQKRIAALSVALEKDCKRYRQAETVAQWMVGEAPKYPGLAGKNLDTASLARIIEKGPRLDGLKGQLLEELGGSSVEQMLGSASGRARLAGEFAGKNLEFIPGYRLRAGDGRQLTDGIVGFWEGDTFHIVTIIESKAGLWAAEGLRLGEAEMSAVRGARFKLMMAAYKRGDRAGAAAVREMDFAGFVRTHRADVDAALRRAEDAGDWPKRAIEDVRERMAADLRAQGKPADAAAMERLSNTAWAAKYPDRMAEAQQLIPLPEAGQFTRDLERTGQLGGKIVDGGALPRIVEDGKLAEVWQGKDVPAGVGRPTKFVGNRGSVRAQGFAPADVDASTLARDIRTGEGVDARVSSVGLSADQLSTLARDIGAQAKAATP
ncbi:MAG TPA: hypothetical protein VM428_06070 [Microlunatus sp.]|nr:hypothetical protein [Microlunatus sp.]